MNYVTVDVFGSVCFIEIQSIKHIQIHWSAAVELFKSTKPINRERHYNRPTRTI